MYRFCLKKQRNLNIFTLWGLSGTFWSSLELSGALWRSGSSLGAPAKLSRALSLIRAHDVAEVDPHNSCAQFVAFSGRIFLPGTSEVDPHNSYAQLVAFSGRIFLPGTSEVTPHNSCAQLVAFSGRIFPREPLNRWTVEPLNRWTVEPLNRWTRFVLLGCLVSRPLKRLEF